MSDDPAAAAEFVLDDDSAIFMQAVRHARLAFCLTDPHRPGNPIVYANRAFLDLTGYSRDEVVGRNCRFLQGPETDAADVARVSGLLRQGEVGTVELVNYRRDGSAFVNALQIGPIHDADGNVRLFFGSQLDVTKEREAERHARRLAEAEMRHRLMNIISIMSVLVRLTGREELDADTQISRINERLQAVGKAHLLALTESADGAPSLSEIAAVVLKAYAPRGQESFALDGPELTVAADNITSLTLALHELATNAVKHGAFSVLEGHVRLAWSEADGAVTLDWQESGGPEVTAVPTRESGSGLVRELLEAAGGGIDFDWRQEGLAAQVRLPPARGGG